MIDHTLITPKTGSPVSLDEDPNILVLSLVGSLLTSHNAISACCEPPPPSFKMMVDESQAMTV